MRGCRYDKNFPYARQHQHGHGIVNEGLVINRKKLLRSGVGDWEQPGTGPTSENDALHLTQRLTTSCDLVEPISEIVFYDLEFLRVAFSSRGAGYPVRVADPVEGRFSVPVQLSAIAGQRLHLGFDMICYVHQQM